MAEQFITRLAPSPTGSQHIGNARTYLISWLMARQAGGRVVLRIEDIDSPRVKAGAMAEAIVDLRWLGLDWDDGPIVQTERMAYYQFALDRLIAANAVYPCTCSRSDIERAASAPHEEGAEPTYPGTCAFRNATDVPTDTGNFAWRFRIRQAPQYVDQFCGPISIDLTKRGGDFVVWKSSRTPAYQMAVVVDDAAQCITHVIRGDDLIPSTPRQLLLYYALGWPPPQFAHVPLVVGTDGRRLAKRHGDTRLAALRDAGVTPEQLIGLLAWSCGWQSTPSPISAYQLIEHFSLSHIPVRPFVLTNEHLHSIGYHV